MKLKLLLAPALLAIITTLSGCEVIGGIFKTGMGVGAFVVIIVVLVIFFLLSRSRKNK